MIVLNSNAYDLYGINQTDHFAETSSATPMEYLSFNQTLFLTGYQRMNGHSISQLIISVSKEYPLNALILSWSRLIWHTRRMPKIYIGMKLIIDDGRH